jgi:hypothetical protein
MIYMRAKITLNGVEFEVLFYPWHPGYGWYEVIKHWFVYVTEKGAMVKACGMGVVDHARPKSWDDENRQFLNVDDYVWCYDRNKTWGEPVNLLQRFQRLMEEQIGFIVTTRNASVFSD